MLFVEPDLLTSAAAPGEASALTLTRDGDALLDTTAGDPLRVTARGGDGDDALRTGDRLDTLLGEATRRATS